MRKRPSTALAAVLTGAFLLTACGIIKTYPQVNTARFHQDLRLTMISAESMDREYYDLDQLETVILDSVNQYNEENPDAISIDYYHVEGELATLILTYQNAEHCAVFNEQPIVYCPASEASEKGQLDGIEWKSAETAMEEAANAETGAAAAEGGTTGEAAAAAEMAEGGTTAEPTAAAAEKAEITEGGATAEAAAAAEKAGTSGTGGTGSGAMAAGPLAADLSSMRFIMLTEPLSVETEDPIVYVSGPVTVTDSRACVTGEEIGEDDPVYILLSAVEAGK